MRLPVVASILLVTLVGAVGPYPHAGQTGGYHSVERVGESRVTDDEGTLAFEELSPEAQDAFRRALDGPDGRSVVWGASNLAPEFYYSDDEGYRYVRYEGEYYLLSFGRAGAGPLARPPRGTLRLPAALLSGDRRGGHDGRTAGEVGVGRAGVVGVARPPRVASERLERA